MNNSLNDLKNWKNKSFVKSLIQAYPGAEIFLVGGSIRDALLGKEIKDFDLVVRGVKKTELGKFLEKRGKVNLVGKRFGVFKFIPKGEEKEIDIALPRTEHSINMSGAYKDFEIKTNETLAITEDLSRRDFTINAMAWNIITNELVDPFDGLKDLRRKKIKAVGEPKKRFQEDYSRMLRAIRFSVQLNFEIEPKTKKAITTEIKKINKKLGDTYIIPREVIASELNKAVIINPVQSLKMLETTGALEVLSPELLKMKKCPQPKKWHKEGDVWKHTLLTLEKATDKNFEKEFGKKAPAEVLWCLVYHDVGKPYTMRRTSRLRFDGHDNVSAQKFEEIAKRLKLSSASINVDNVKTLIAKHMLPATAQIDQMKDTTIEKYFYSESFPGEELMMVLFADISASIHASGKADFTDYKKIKQRIKKLSKNQKTLPKPLIDGNDILKYLKVKSGPKIGKLLTLSREAQLNGKIKTKKEGLDYLKKHL